MKNLTYKFNIVDNQEVLVTSKPVLIWSEEDQTGYQTLFLTPAFRAHNKGRCWILEQSHQPKPEYCGDGDYKIIIEFEAGIKLLIEQEVFNFPTE